MYGLALILDKHSFQHSATVGRNLQTLTITHALTHTRTRTQRHYLSMYYLEIDKDRLVIFYTQILLLIIRDKNIFPEKLKLRNHLRKLCIILSEYTLHNT